MFDLVLLLIRMRMLAGVVIALGIVTIVIPTLPMQIASIDITKQLNQSIMLRTDLIRIIQ